jgi:hypothetical protein
MGILLIGAAGLAWVLLFEPEWMTNHWRHWLFWD